MSEQNNNFLPSGYDVPQSSGNYMKFQDGENKFRILGSPIIGWESWKTLEDGSRKPVRRPMNNPFTTSEVEDPTTVKHFWAMPVWNYTDEKIQILEITQKGIQKSIKALAKDEDWGSPINYDLVVTKEGKDLLTKYQVNPKPIKKLDPLVSKLFNQSHIDLEALYKGDDPFASKGENEVKADEIPDF